MTGQGWTMADTSDMIADRRPRGTDMQYEDADFF